MGNYEKAAALIPDAVNGENEKAILVESLENNIKTAFEQGRLASCRNIITRLQSIQLDNQCAREFLEKLEEREKRQ